MSCRIGGAELCLDGGVSRPCAAGFVDAGVSSIAGQVDALYPLGTMFFQLSLIDQFNDAHPMCDAAVWASESPLFRSPKSPAFPIERPGIVQAPA